MSPQRRPGTTRERIYRYVREMIQTGLPPTVREVQEAFGFRAVQSAREHLERLVEEGRLTKQSGKSRGYGLPDAPEGLAVMVPILGRIQAGDLQSAIANPDGTVPLLLPRKPRFRRRVRVPSSRSKREVDVPGLADGFFALRVVGESMSGIGILPDDIVIVRSQSVAESGEVIVALVADESAPEPEATVKRLRTRRGKIELHPENPDFDPIVPAPGSCTILGKVIEVRREL